MIYFYSWWRGIEKKFKFDFMLMVFTPSQSILHWISSTIINYYFFVWFMLFSNIFCVLFKHEKRYFFASWSFKLPYATDYWYAASFDVMLCFQCEKELNRKIVSQKKVEQKKLNRKKIKQKKTVLYRSKKNSHRCVWA